MFTIIYALPPKMGVYVWHECVSGVPNVCKGCVKGASSDVSSPSGRKRILAYFGYRTSFCSYICWCFESVNQCFVSHLGQGRGFVQLLQCSTSPALKPGFATNIFILCYCCCHAIENTSLCSVFTERNSRLNEWCVWLIRLDVRTIIRTANKYYPLKLVTVYK